MTATTWVGTSWKMNKLLAEAKAFASRLQECPPPPGIQRFVIPPFPAISAVAEALGPDPDVIVGAQNAHWEDGGAWTGEVSVPQAKDAGSEIYDRELVLSAVLKQQVPSKISSLCLIGSCEELRLTGDWLSPARLRISSPGGRSLIG